MKRSKEFKDVAEAMGRIDICMMQTVGEHGVNTRPMSNNGEVEYDGDNWFFSRSDSTKNEEIALDDRVQLTFADRDGMNFISVWGQGEIVDDTAMKKKLWQKDLERWFENGPEDPAVSLIKVSAQRIQTWGRMGDHTLELDSD
ncbi:pyridoxamine 5'-phosphate oxidase family protein [Luteimonas vadosa]|uniref:Pyridoxamine 5'-phosphate oxidase family protein n=1 Tax=Luteimonas vadosa TaxID=1165507 RepID=A0ABP9E661_9GAMM